MSNKKQKIAEYNRCFKCNKHKHIEKRHFKYYNCWQFMAEMFVCELNPEITRDREYSFTDALTASKLFMNILGNH